MKEYRNRSRRGPWPPIEPNRMEYQPQWKHIRWIVLRENLQETLDFLIKYGAFL